MTLVELIVVLTILLVVLGTIVDSFASATKAETDQVARADAQQNARLALETMRRDIHCASAADPTTTGVLRLTEPALPCAQPTTAVSTIVWCATGSAGRYMIRRSTTATCNSASMPKADYLTTNAIWSNAACSTGRALAIAVDLPVGVRGNTQGPKLYELKDSIALRNGTALCP